MTEPADCLAATLLVGAVVVAPCDVTVDAFPATGDDEVAPEADGLDFGSSACVFASDPESLDFADFAAAAGFAEEVGGFAISAVLAGAVFATGTAFAGVGLLTAPGLAVPEFFVTATGFADDDFAPAFARAVDAGFALGSTAVIFALPVASPFAELALPGIDVAEIDVAELDFAGLDFAGLDFAELAFVEPDELDVTFVGVPDLTDALLDGALLEDALLVNAAVGDFEDPDVLVPAGDLGAALAAGFAADFAGEDAVATRVEMEDGGLDPDLSFSAFSFSAPFADPAGVFGFVATIVPFSQAVSVKPFNNRTSLRSLHEAHREKSPSTA